MLCGIPRNFEREIQIKVHVQYYRALCHCHFVTKTLFVSCLSAAIMSSRTTILPPLGTPQSYLASVGTEFDTLLASTKSLPRLGRAIFKVMSASTRRHELLLHLKSLDALEHTLNLAAARTRRLLPMLSRMKRETQGHYLTHLENLLPLDKELVPTSPTSRTSLTPVEVSSTAPTIILDHSPESIEDSLCTPPSLHSHEPPPLVRSIYGVPRVWGNRGPRSMDSSQIPSRFILSPSQGTQDRPSGSTVTDRATTL